MCILFLLIGDQKRPTLICSNRDEYYNRKTIRGDFDQEGFQYSPLDVEGGGTWISAAGLDQSAENFRYAVVLNFHHWREGHPFRKTAESKAGQQSTSLRSRGLLIKNFMDDLTCSAMTYANIMYKDRALYRPFNLIVSDRSGTYYISSSKQQKGRPEKLLPGRLYGLSNGYMHDAWEKTTVGRLLVGKALIKDYKLFAHADSVKGKMPSKNDNTEEFALVGEPSLDIKFVMLKLMQVMKNDKALSDATFETQSAPGMQLSSIYVQPTLILRQPFEQRTSILMFIIRAVIAVAKEILQYCLSVLVLNSVEAPAILSSLSGDWYERVALFLHTAAILGMFQLPHADQIGGPLAHKDLFGTRTITLIYHMPKTPQENTRSSPDQQPNQHNDQYHQYSKNNNHYNSNSSHRQSPQYSHKASEAHCSDFCIMEKDLNPVSMVWSTNEFSNMQ